MTIKDLAAATGYSVGTISRVLNNQPNVSEKARQTILKAAADADFQLNSNAKQLKQQHGNSILVVSKGISNELFEQLVEAIQKLVSRTNYPLVVDYIDENENEVLRAVKLCRELKPRGILFLGGNQENFLSHFHQISQPCVLVTNDAGELPFRNLSSVSSDNVLAARMAIDHLVELGHRKIAVIGGDPQVSDTTKLRYSGCLEAFRAHGIDFDEARDYEATRFSHADGYNAAMNLLNRGREFTALFAMSDVMAIGAIRALTDAGRKVPEEVSVVGLDGLDIGRFLVPRLSTVEQSVELLAQRSLELLCGAIERNQPASHVTIPVTLLPRESTLKHN